MQKENNGEYKSRNINKPKQTLGYLAMNSINAKLGQTVRTFPIDYH